MTTTIIASSRPAGRPAARRPSALPLFVVLMAALATVGGVLAVRLVQTAPSASGPQVEGTVETSFGSLEVHQSEVLNGLSSSALGGMSHGVQNLVDDTQAEIAVSVTIVDTKAAHLQYSADKFRLRSGADRPGGARIAPLGTSLSSGVLDKGGRVEGSLNFVTPLNGKQLWLEYIDNGRSVAVRLQALALAPAGGSTDDTPGVGGSHEDH
jgi:hypothetical protein